MPEVGPGWERDKRMHFDEIVGHYDKIRPEYPRELYADIFAYAGAGKNAIEIGPGTGKATRPFLDGGYNITAIEIGANMTEFLQEKYKNYPNFSALTAAFEDAELAEEHFDLIYAATSFHWVDAEVGCPKALRLLRSGGAIALLRNNAMPGDGGEIYEAMQTVYEKYYHKPYKRPVMKTKEDFNTHDGIYISYRFKDLASYGFTDITMKFYDATRTFTADEYIALLDTFSDHRQLPESDRMALYAGVKDAILAHGGLHKVDYIYQLYMGRK